MADGQIPKTPEEWRNVLTPEEYEVCINHGTEPPFSGRYNYVKADGSYRCTCCGEELFSSDAKFDSGSGWPSFWAPVDEKRIEYVRDSSFGMARVEVNCNRCGAHLGHVFDDGPQPTNQRYCINSVSLRHESDEIRGAGGIGHGSEVDDDDDDDGHDSSSGDDDDDNARSSTGAPGRGPGQDA